MVGLLNCGCTCSLGKLGVYHLHCFHDNEINSLVNDERCTGVEKLVWSYEPSADLQQSLTTVLLSYVRIPRLEQKTSNLQGKNNLSTYIFSCENLPHCKVAKVYLMVKCRTNFKVRIQTNIVWNGCHCSIFLLLFACKIYVQ